MAVSIAKYVAKSSEHLANREQRLVTIVFIVAAVFYSVSYIPSAWFFFVGLFFDPSRSREFIESLTWTMVMREVGIVAFTVSTGLAMIVAYMRIFNARWDDLQAMYFLKDHTIICGMSTRGKVMAESIVAKGGQVVIIDIAEKHEEAAEHRGKGVFVLHGDATMIDRLKDAGLFRAKDIVCLTDKDETNVMILETVRRAMDSLEAKNERSGASESGKLICHCHIADQNMSRYMQELPSLRISNPHVLYRIFNIHSITAAELLRKFPLDSAFSVNQPTPEYRATLIGSRQFAMALAYEMAQQCHYPMQANAMVAPVPVLTIVNEHATDIIQSIRDECPPITKFVQLEEKSIAPKQLGQLDALVEAHPESGCIYVAMDDEISTLAIASRVQRIVKRKQLSHVTVVAITPPKTVRLSLGQWQDANAAPVIEAYESATSDVALEGARDKMARDVHELYIKNQIAKGAMHTPPRPAERPWGDLDDFLRESNRQQVAHMSIKLRVLGLQIKEGIDSTKSSEQGNLANVLEDNPVLDILAAMEHQRWMAFHLVRGWQQAGAGQSRDDSIRVHEYLIPFKELTKQIADYDRDVVKNMAAICLGAQLELEKTH
jgi:voltage-gated potassium channel Kch